MDGQFTSLQTACQDYFISDGFLFFNQPTDGSGCCTAEASCRNHDMFLPRIFTRDQRWSQKVLSSWNSSMLGRGDQWMVSHFRVHTHRQQASISKYDIAYFLWDMMALVQNSSLPQQHDVLFMWYCWYCYSFTNPASGRRSWDRPNLCAGQGATRHNLQAIWSPAMSIDVLSILPSIGKNP